MAIKCQQPQLLLLQFTTTRNRGAASKRSMGLRLVILVGVLLFFFCIAQVSCSDAQVEEEEALKVQVVKGVNRRLMTFVDCGGLCGRRCSLHSRPNVCTRACGTCCMRCKCVPPGTSGNRHMCGRCYTDMTTHRNQPKCP